MSFFGFYVYMETTYKSLEVSTDGSRNVFTTTNRTPNTVIDGAGNSEIEISIMTPKELIICKHCRIELPGQTVGFLL